MNGHNKSTFLQNKKDRMELELKHTNELIAIHQEYSIKIEEQDQCIYTLRSNIHDTLFDNSDSIPENIYIILMNLLKTSSSSSLDTWTVRSELDADLLVE